MRIKVLEEKPVTAAEVKDELKKIKKADKELNFRAQKTEDYLNQIVSDSKKSAELAKKLEGLKIPRLREQQIAKLVDIMPTTEQDVKFVLQGYALTVTKDNMKKIAKAIEDFAKKE
jgi:DNA-directed RNA polymerase subunit F